MTFYSPETQGSRPYGGSETGIGRAEYWRRRNGVTLKREKGYDGFKLTGSISSLDNAK
jgi:hypothetical protein